VDDAIDGLAPTLPLLHRSLAKEQIMNARTRITRRITVTGFAIAGAIGFALMIAPWRQPVLMPAVRLPSVEVRPNATLVDQVTITQADADTRDGLVAVVETEAAPTVTAL
jgi:hypothetical protein